MGVTSQDAAGRLGENVRQLRLLRALTQEQISRLAGVPRATWANLESGAREHLVFGRNEPGLAHRHQTWEEAINSSA